MRNKCPQENCSLIIGMDANCQFSDTERDSSAIGNITMPPARDRNSTKAEQNKNATIITWIEDKRLKCLNTLSKTDPAGRCGTRRRHGGPCEDEESWDRQIDYITAEDNIRLTDCWLDRVAGEGSDHRPLIATIQISSAPTLKRRKRAACPKNWIPCEQWSRDIDLGPMPTDWTRLAESWGKLVRKHRRKRTTEEQNVCSKHESQQYETSSGTPLIQRLGRKRTCAGNNGD